MTPEQIAALNAIMQIIQKLGTWPVLSTVSLLVFGPEILLFFITWDQRRDLKHMIEEQGKVIRKQDERFEKVVNMYESNVALVKSYEAISKGYREIIIFNTQQITEIRNISENNLYCPIVRKQTRQKEIDNS